MILKGQLNLSHDKDDYIIFSKGRLVNLTDYLNMMLMDNVKFEIKQMYNKKVMISAEGQLLKQRISKGFYLFHIGDVNIDNVLWNLVGSKLEIELININS